MPEEPNEPSSPEQSSEENQSSAEQRARSRSKSLTPEQRRFLGAPRSLHKRGEDEPAKVEGETQIPAAEEEQPGFTPAPPPTPVRRPAEMPPPESRRARAAEVPSPVRPEPEPRKPASPVAAVSPDQKSSRAREMQGAALILGALLLIALTFYVGKNFETWKYRLFSSRNQPKLDAAADKYPGVSPDELVAQGLAAERAGKWQEAADRYMSAKRKDLRYRGLLFRVGKLAYDHNDLTAADKLFERAVAFGENVDAANCMRGLIAARRRDFTAAEHFFEAAASVEPFIAFYPFYWGEVLRMDQHPKESIPHYKRAELLAVSVQDAAVFRFKAQIARLEAGDTAGVTADLTKIGDAGPLPTEWLMTQAALRIRSGHPDQAARIMSEARVQAQPLVFASCVRDMLFADAEKKYPELAEFAQSPATQTLPGP